MGRGVCVCVGGGEENEISEGEGIYPRTVCMRSEGSNDQLWCRQLWCLLYIYHRRLLMRHRASFICHSHGHINLYRDFHLAWEKIDMH